MCCRYVKSFKITLMSKKRLKKNKCEKKNKKKINQMEKEKTTKNKKLKKWNNFLFNDKIIVFSIITVASVNHATVSNLNAVNNNPMLLQIQLQKQHQQLHPQNQQQ